MLSTGERSASQHPKVPKIQYFAVFNKKGTLQVNTMNADRYSTFKYAYEIEKLEATTLVELVAEKAVEAGFLTMSDSEEDRAKLAWIKIVTQHAEHSFRLEEVADDESIEIKVKNLNQLQRRRDKYVKEVLELLAEHIVDAAPRYKV